MSLPPRVYSSTAAWKRLPSHSSHGDSTVAITPSSVKITPAPLQVGQAPSELELNSAGFTPLALANALRIGSSSPVYVAGLLRRDPLIAPWSIDHDAVAAGDRAVDQRALARAGDAGDDAQHAERDVDVDVAEVVRRRRRAPPARRSPCAPTSLSAGPVVEVPAGDGVAGAQPVDGALEADLAAVGAGAGAEVDDVVGDRDRLRLVLDDQHGVALVAQLQQQVVHPLDVVRVQPDGGLVEDVGDVGQRRAEVADHLGALGLAARTACRPGGRGRGSRGRSRRTSRAGAAGPASSGATDGSSSSRTQSARSLICIAHRSAMFLPSIFEDRASWVSRVPSQSGQVWKVTARSTNAADVRLHRLDVLGEHRLLDLAGSIPSKVRLMPSTLILVGSA